MGSGGDIRLLMSRGFFWSSPGIEAIGDVIGANLMDSLACDVADMVDDEGADIGEGEVVGRIEEKVCGEADGRSRVITGGMAVMTLGELWLSAMAVLGGQFAGNGRVYVWSMTPSNPNWAQRSERDCLTLTWCAVVRRRLRSSRTGRPQELRGE